MIFHATMEQCREYALKYLEASEEELRRGLELHKKAFVCDSFGFLPFIHTKKECDKVLGMAAKGATAEELLTAGEQFCNRNMPHDPEVKEKFLEVIQLTGIKCTVHTTGSEMDLEHSMQRIAQTQYKLDSMRDVLYKALSPADVEKARKENKLAVICSTNCAPVHGGIATGPQAHAWIDIFFNLGIRIMHLTYNRRNWVGDGCLEPANGGLSLHGRDVIKQFNELGMVVDTPHTGRQTTLDAAEYSRAPIMATHTFCKSVYNHPRGKTDEELTLIGEKGGYIGICTVPCFLKERPTINSLLDHIDYAVKVAGIDHVGIGSDSGYCLYQDEIVPDFNDHYPKASPYSKLPWYGAWAPGLLRYEEIPDDCRFSLAWTNWPYFTVGLVKRGYSDEDIMKLLGGNFMRTWGKIQECSQKYI